MKKFFSSKTNIVLTILLIVAIAIASILLIDVFNKEIIADDFSTYSEIEINNWAKENDVLDLLTIDHKYDEVIENGKVIYQSVKPGESINDGITIIISKGKDPDALIDIFKISETSNKIDVENWANDNGLSNVYYQYILSDKDIDSVISINKNNSIKKDDEIIVTLSCGENEENISIIVPDFSKISKDDISLWASGYGIEIEFIYNEDTNKTNDSFISQTPLKYSSIKPGSKVEIVLTSNNENNSEITVPDNLLWLNESDFIKTIEKLNLKPVKQNQTYKKLGKDDGTIYAYDSSSDGIKFKVGDTVKYWLVNNGNKNDTITVPDDYLGMSEKDFIAKIEGLGLKVSKQTQTYSSKKYNAGTIYAYDSTSDGINFKKGDTVKYWLVSGTSDTPASDKVTVPDDYLGMSEKDFIAKIEGLGLKVSKQTQTYSSKKYNAGTIYAYDSTSDGINFKKGDTVKYWLVSGNSQGGSSSGGSTTEEKITLKNLVGSSKSDAESYCSSNGFYTNYSEQYSSSVAAGKIISMNPNAGSQVAKGTEITFVVSKGENVAWIVNVNDLNQIYRGTSYNSTISNLTSYFNDQGFTNYSFTEDLETTKASGVITGCTINGSTYKEGEYPVSSNIVVKISNRDK